MGLAFELPLLLHLEFDIKLFPFAQRPSWISDFRLRRIVFPICPMNCWTLKMGVAAEVLFLGGLEPEILGGGHF